MKRNRRTSALICCVVLCLATTFCTCFCTALAVGSERPTVRVGFFAFDGYHVKGEDGTLSGYGYELIQRMAGYTNWNVEYVGYDKSWADMQEMLANGQIDLVTSAQKTDERLQRFDFSDEPIGTSSAILTVKAGDETFTAGDYTRWDGMRVGMIQNNSRNDAFAQLAAEYGFTYETVFFNSVEEMSEELQRGGRIDAILTSSLRAIKDEWVLTQFDASPFYVMVKKGNAELLADINNALGSLFSIETGIRTQLMNKYYSPDSGDEIAFTAEERAFIRSMEDVVFTAIINPDREPYSFIDKETGEYTGVLFDIATEVIKRSGLNIEFAKITARKEYIERAESNDFDIRFDAGYDLYLADKGDYKLTTSYLSAPISRLFLKSTETFHTAAMLDRGVILHALEDDLKEQGMELFSYESTQSAIDAVLDGECDVAYINSRAAATAMLGEPTNRLVAEELLGYTGDYAIAVNSDADPLLYSVLNKSVASLWQPDIDAIINRYSEYEDEPFTLLGYLYDNPVKVIVFVAVFFLFVSLVLWLFKLSQKRKQDRLHIEDEERRNALLADALATAENADAAKSQFLSRMSHEMRTPLNAIIGFMELAKYANEQDTKTYLRNSDMAAKQLLSVINDVLDMSAIEAGKLKIARTRFSFKNTLKSITDIYFPLCVQKGIEYETKILTSVDEWLVGDKMRVSQIMMNLLGNAIKFTQKGHVWLKISQTETRGNEVFIRIEVTDTGCGMSDDMLSRIFKPFEQEDENTAQKHGGSGLGLSIVKNLVTMMNGAIRVESKPNIGSTFIVDLPFGKSDDESADKIPIDAGRLRVLAVDDGENERDYMSLILGRMNVRHTCVASCEEALDKLKEATAEGDAYNVCLVDWRMPIVDGIETTQRIRTKYGNDVVVIIVSAYEQSRVNEQALQAGANMFMAKPLFQSTLFDLFMNLTDGDITHAEKSPTVRNLTNHRVLLAEDVEMNRIVAEGLLEMLGVECDCANDGGAVLKMFTESPAGKYDAILMDVKMPVMDGYAATKAIRASDHPDAKSISIIALSADAFNEDIAKALSSGMNAHVAKPIETAALAEALTAAFNR